MLPGRLLALPMILWNISTTSPTEMAQSYQLSNLWPISALFFAIFSDIQSHNGIFIVFLYQNAYLITQKKYYQGSRISTIIFPKLQNPEGGSQEGESRGYWVM